MPAKFENFGVFLANIKHFSEAKTGKRQKPTIAILTPTHLDIILRYERIPVKQG
jgi:hypothetical protein